MNLLVLWLALAVPIWSDEVPDDTFGETIDVHLVTVEVAVEDWPSGEPVVDLVVGDFEIREDGEIQPITHFEKIVAGRVALAEAGLEAKEPEAATGAEGAPLPRFVVLGFDLGSLQPVRLKYSTKKAKAYVQETAAPHVYWSVAILGPNPRVMLPFSSDPGKVATTLDSLYGYRMGRSVLSWGLGSFEPENTLAASGEATSRASANLEELIESTRETAGLVAAQELFDSLEELFRGWSSLEGNKSLILYYQTGESHGRGSGAVRDNNQKIHEAVEGVPGRPRLQDSRFTRPMPPVYRIRR